MSHPLDNPAFNALNSGNASLAFGTDNVKFFDLKASPFVGLKEPTELNFEVLRNSVTEGFYLFVMPEHLPIPSQWKVINHTSGLQMVFEGKPIAFEPRYELV